MEDSEECILRVENVSKNYDYVIALKDINFEIKKGEIFGLLGRNGGGKTTIIKIITSNLDNFQGDIKIGGISIKNKKFLKYFKENVAYLPDKEFLNKKMNANEYIRFFKDFFSDFDSTKAYKIFMLLNIDPSKKIYSLSKGEVEKLGLALMLSRNAKLFIFDEPLAGADIISRDEIFKLIQESCNGAVLIATHLISSVEKILSKALYLNTKVISYGDKSSLLDGFDNLEDSFRYYASDLNRDKIFRTSFNCKNNEEIEIR